MNLFALIILPLIAAALGWIGVRIALRLLFHPLQPKRFFGFVIQGLFPRQQPQIAAGLGRKASELLDISSIAARSKDPALIAALMPGIERHIDGFLQQRLKEKIPVLAMFLSDSVLQTIRTSLLEEIEGLLPQVISQFADGLGSTLDVGKLVTTKLAAIPPEQLEDTLRTAMSREIRMLETAGAGLGFLIGLIQLGLSALLQAM